MLSIYYFSVLMVKNGNNCLVVLTHRPFMPLVYRKMGFNCLHSLSHPGVCTTVKLIMERFSWLKMNSSMLIVIGIQTIVLSVAQIIQLIILCVQCLVLVTVIRPMLKTVTKII